MNYLANIIVPTWARWLFLLAAFGIVYLLGQLHGERVAGQRHTDYVVAQATQTVKIGQAQTRVVVRTEIEYRDRIQKVYLKGDEIEKVVDHYITPADDERFAVNAGFVRNYDAAWSGEPAGPAAESDREPAGIPLSVVGKVEAENATTCKAWREQALGWPVFYARQQVAINGKAGAWAAALLPQLTAKD